jgi:hypothetical protein
MAVRLSPGISELEKRLLGVTGLLKVEAGEGDFVQVQFTPSKPQLQVFTTSVRRGAALQALLEKLGVPPVYRPKIQEYRTWAREITLTPSPEILKALSGK